MRNSKAAPYIFLLVLAIAAVVISRFRNNTPAKKEVKTEQKDRARPSKDDKRTRNTKDPASDPEGRKEGLNRRLQPLVLTKHARCRMECRHIDESEVKEILETGVINYRKSELNNAPCSNKYAVEGYSHDKQHLRIIFAPCDDGMHVVTCIDLDTEWSCNCN
jgi:Domain of unknown function (DUF4258)